MSCSSDDDGGDVTTPRDINTLNQAMTTDESIFECRGLVDCGWVYKNNVVQQI